MKLIKNIILSLLSITTATSVLANREQPNYFDKGYIGINAGLLNSIGKSNITATSTGTFYNTPGDYVYVNDPFFPYFQATGLTQTANINNTQNLNKGVHAIGFVSGVNTGYNKVFNNDKLLIGVDLLADVTKLESKMKAPSSAVVSTIPTTSATGNSILADTNYNNFLESKISMNWSIGAGAKFGTIVNSSVLLYTSLHWVASQWKIEGIAQQPISDCNAVRFNTSGALSAVSKKKISNGVRFGIGAATPLTNNLIAGLDIGYTRYGQIKASNTSSIGVSNNGSEILIVPTGEKGSLVQKVFNYTTTSTYKHKPRLIDVRLKLTWQFNGIA